MTIDELISYGFKEWPINPQLDKHDRQWQYCVRDEFGKKFFVQVRLWQFSRYATPSNPSIPDGFDAYCQFDMNGPKTFNVDLSVSNMTPAQVVEWFGNVFDKLGCTHYEASGAEIADGNCEKCGAYIPNHSDAYCPKCQYQVDTGFKRGQFTKRKRRR